MFVVDRDSVRCPVSLLILWYHHRDGQRLEAFTWERDTYIPAMWTVGCEYTMVCHQSPTSAELKGGLCGYTHLVCLIIQAICSVEHPAPGMIRSPSFSRASSSITTTNSPRAMAATALSIESNAKVVRTGGIRSFGALRGGEEMSGPSRGGSE